MTESAWTDRLRDNLAQVRGAIADACQRSGRAPTAVRLIAVTKYVPVSVLRAVVAAGVDDLGESQVQQLTARARECGPQQFDWAGEHRGVPRWHMIGHVQRNKVKALLPHARIIHSLDSQRLADTLEQHAAAIGAEVSVFIEVNIAGEATKEGVTPTEVPGLIAGLARCPHLRLRGLMTMAPFDPDPERARPHFARLRMLRDELQATGVAGPDCVHLSMGMSQDYVVAVEEGATCVRVGSALFAGLPTSDPRAG
ncbi:MAG: YggS family pyridoxal phosphate-dependent enzyme [Phycisphaerae bacterium]|nr:YggS family pyridoxal phosphate-dependent enzyme [Phycisphaerae bacterium]